jgi:peptidoglycan/xylan/chitin deacetylase (PgdA/CDA1 family)
MLGPLAPVARWAASSLGVPRGLPGQRGVALTFDDGPHPEGTPGVLEILGASGATATFFLVGEQVQRRPELAARIAGAGHLVALHGYRHRLQLRMSAAEVRADLERGASVLADGIYSPAGLAAARDQGLRPLLWSKWGKDWRKFTTAERIAARATERVSAGDVILLHDADFYSSAGSHRRTIQALPAVLSELTRRGLDTVLPV